MNAEVQRRLQPKLTSLHIIRWMIPLFAAMWAIDRIRPTSTVAALCLALFTWLLARWCTKRILRTFARALWRHGRWRGVRLEGGWYTLWRAPAGSPEQRRIADQIEREFPSEAAAQLHTRRPAR